MKKRVVNIIVEQLINEDIEYVFGVTGKTIAPFLDAVIDYDKIEYISSRHESGAALMAYGYAQGSGKLGVCCGSTGGGSTNLATGVASAYALPGGRAKEIIIGLEKVKIGTFL